MKKILFIKWLLLFSAGSLFSQTSSFYTFFGTQEDEYAVNITVGHENDIIVCGSSYSYGSSNDGEPFAARLDVNGNLLNYITFPNQLNYTSYFFDIHVTDQGYLLLGAGDDYLASSATPNNHIILYQTDMYLNVIDSASIFLSNNYGMRLWQANSYLDSDNNVVICGWHLSGPGFVTNFILKTDIAGDVIHKHIGNFPGHSSGRFDAIVEAHDQNGYYLSWFESSEEGTYLLYLNKDLEFQHVIPVDGAPSSYNYLANMKKLGGENLVFTARGPYSGYPLHQHYILGYNVPTNQMLEAAEFGERRRRDNIPNRPLHVKDNAIFLTYGYLYTSFYFFPADSNAFYVQKLDNNFNMLWEQEIYFDGMNHHARAIHGTDDGGCVVFAQVYDPDTMHFQHDVLVVKLDENGHVTSRNTLEGIASPLLLYPNPGKDHFYLNASAAMERAEIYTLQGKRVKEVLLSPGENRISMTPFPPGTYMVRALDNRGTVRQSGKWIKVRIDG